MTEAERVKAWRDKKRGQPPRPYHKQRSKGQQFGGHGADEARARAIRAAWDDPLLRAVMSAQKVYAQAARASRTS